MPVVVSAGVPINYEIAGEGPPIVLVHGYLTSFEGNWGQSGWIEFLIGRGRSVIGLDCRGHGRSGKPHDPAAYEDPRMPDDVLAVMDAVGLGRVDLMGYSMGGYIGIALLARHPDRFRDVIVGGAGLGNPPNLEVDAAIAAALEADDPSSITDPVAAFYREVAESRAQDPHSLADRDPDLHALAAIARRRRGLRWVPDDAEARLRTVQVRLLAVVGDKDEALPQAQRLTETVPKAELVVLPGEDHLSAIRAQGYKDAVAAFL
jgi:pimeloyl-ACP methyl ester carboxylesterase